MGIERGRDAVAATREEKNKKRRYAGLAISPCVFEIAGRAGDAAQGLVRAGRVVGLGDVRVRSREGEVLRLRHV